MTLPGSSSRDREQALVILQDISDRYSLTLGVAGYLVADLTWLIAGALIGDRRRAKVTPRS